MKNMKTLLTALMLLCCGLGVRAQHDANDPVVDRTGWTWQASTTCATGYEGAGDGYIDAAFDGKAETYWHSDWAGSAPGAPLPQYVMIDLGKEVTFEGFTYMPRPKNGNGSTIGWRFYVSNTPFDLTGTIAQNASREKLGEPALTDTFAYNSSCVEKCAVFDAPQTGRYILLVSDFSNSGTHFTCAEFNLLRTAQHTARKMLASDITVAGGLTKGTAFFQYDDAKLSAAITAAQAVLDNESATFTQLGAAVNKLSREVHLAKNHPDATKYYQLISANPLFQQEQKVEKTIIAGDTLFTWGTVNKDDYACYWKFEYVGSEYDWNRMYIKSFKTSQYITKLKSGTLKSGTLTPDGAVIQLNTLAGTGEQQYNVLVGGSPMHTEGHSAGKGGSGNLVSYGGGVNTSSAWYLREVTLEAPDNALINRLETFLTDNSSNHTASPVTIGQYPTAFYNTLQSAKEAFVGDKTDATRTAALTALANVPYSQVRPVFMIENKHSTYGVGKGIIEDDAAGINHFTALNKFDNRMLWVINFTDQTPATGTFEIYNLATKHPLHTDKHPTFNDLTVAISNTSNATPEGATPQYLMKQSTFAPIHAQEVDALLVEWNSTTRDAGSAWEFKYVGTTAEMPSAEDFAAYQAINASLKSDLANYKTRSAAGLNNYTHPTKSYEQVKTDLDAFAKRLDALTYENLVGSANQVKSDADAFLAELAINQPADGSFLRVRSVPTKVYLNTNNTPSQYNGTNRADFRSSTAADAIFYLKDGKLLNLQSGYYLENNTANMLFTNGITTGTTFAFTRAKSGIGEYNVKYNNNGRALYCNTSSGVNYADGAGDATTDNRYNFWLEEVNTLPVSVSAAGYATLCAPVALTLPAGVKAYTGTKHGEWLTLTEVVGTIPAGTPVILTAAEGTYDFAVTESNATAPVQDLQGTTATVLATSATNPYTLQAPQEGVGLYPYTGEQLKGFKAYLLGDAAVNGYKLGGEATGIYGIESESNAPAAIYDLSGRRVKQLGKGMFIIGGQKVLVK